MALSEDEKWMSLCLEEAKKAAEAGEVPVGAVIVKDGKPICRTHNLCEATHDATAHAERLAISEASATLSRWRLSDCTLYVTMEPCPMCAGAMIHARMGRLVYGTPDARAGACGSLIDLSAYPLECKIPTEGGVLQAECAALLRDFFARHARDKR